ncbi:hypothetical protein D9611_012364 [Ephemerocybe angulata]|uniref:Uncharacterized protein n=1 Tax=Ephemerocybe angulata TaxID=980116 RepID=A0A8H5FKE7_9AGAR|nr:hypothetical protein D9611_012364 [Tulosesus angulatus]
MEPSQELNPNTNLLLSLQPKIPRRTSSRTEHLSRKSSVSASGSASTSLAPTPPAPWLMRCTSQASLRGGKSACTTSLSEWDEEWEVLLPVASVTVVLSGGMGAPLGVNKEESVGMLPARPASSPPSRSSSPSTALPPPIPSVESSSDPSGPSAHPPCYFRPPSQRAQASSRLGPLQSLQYIGSPTVGLGAGAYETSTTVDTNTDTNANPTTAPTLPDQLQDRDDYADSAIGRSDSLTINSSHPPGSEGATHPDPTLPIATPMTVTPPATLETQIAHSLRRLYKHRLRSQLLLFNGDVCLRADCRLVGSGYGVERGDESEDAVLSAVLILGANGRMGRVMCYSRYDDDCVPPSLQPPLPNVGVERILESEYGRKRAGG